MPRDNRTLTGDADYGAVGTVSKPIPCAGYDKANVATEGNATTGVLTLYGGITPGGPWFSLAETLTGNEQTGPFSIAGYAFIGWGVTTAEAGKKAQVTVFMTESGV